MAKFIGIPLTVSNGNKIPPTAQPEILTNGDFSDPTDGWTFGANTSIIGGKLVCTNSTAYSPTYQSVTISQKAYVVTFTIDSISGGSVTPSFQNSINLTSRSAAGTYTEKVVAPSPSTRFDFYSVTAGVSFEISNVSIKEIAATETPTYGSPEYVTNGDFSDAGNDWTETGGWTFTGDKANRASVTSNSYIAQDISVEVGRKYEVSYTRTYISGDGVTNLFSNFFDADPAERVTLASYTGTVAETVTVKAVWVSTYSGTLSFRLYGANDFTGSIDDVSIKEVPFVESSNLVNKPYTQSFSLAENWSALSSLLNFRGDNSSPSYASSEINLEFGKTYRVKFDILNKTLGGTVNAGISNTGYFSGVPSSQRVTTSTGNTSFDFIAVLEDVADKDDAIKFVGQSTDTYTIANFSITEVGYNYLQVADGGFTKSVKEGDIIFNTSTNTEGVVKEVLDNNALLMSNDNFSTAGEFFNVFAANGDTRGNQIIRVDNYIMSEYDENPTDPDQSSFWFAGGVNADKVVLTQLNNATNTFFVADVIEKHIEQVNAQSSTASRLNIPLDAFRDHEYNEVLTTTAITLS